MRWKASPPGAWTQCLDPVKGGITREARCEARDRVGKGGRGRSNGPPHSAWILSGGRAREDMSHAA